MSEPPQIVDVPAQNTACIRLTIPPSAMQKEMGPAIAELYASLKEQSVAPEGPLFAHYLRFDPVTFDFEVGVPVAVPVSESGRLRPGHIPASRVARTVYSGPYEGLQSAWGDLSDWIRSQGLTIGPNFWEVYLQGPESGDDPRQWRTELNRTLVA